MEATATFGGDFFFRIFLYLNFFLFVSYVTQRKTTSPVVLFCFHSVSILLPFCFPQGAYALLEIPRHRQLIQFHITEFQFRAFNMEMESNSARNRSHSHQIQLELNSISRRSNRINRQPSIETDPHRQWLKGSNNQSISLLRLQTPSSKLRLIRARWWLISTSFKAVKEPTKVQYNLITFKANARPQKSQKPIVATGNNSSV